ncbi:hypothetical protein Y032_0047g1458 [Ancylostoma ceylanicum]|nr:hypothetical protein Y032_0047g1458 [Ancylostoma ceylanicum]
MKLIVKDPDNETITALVKGMDDSHLPTGPFVAAAFSSILFLFLFVLGNLLSIIMIVLIAIVAGRLRKQANGFRNFQCPVSVIGATLVASIVFLVILAVILITNLNTIRFRAALKEKRLSSRFEKHKEQSLCVFGKVMNNYGSYSAVSIVKKSQDSVGKKAESYVMSNGLEEIAAKKSTVDSVLQGISELDDSGLKEKEGEIKKYIAINMTKDTVLGSVRKITDACVLKVTKTVMSLYKKKVAQIFAKILDVVMTSQPDAMYMIPATTFLHGTHLNLSFVLILLMCTILIICTISFFVRYEAQKREGRCRYLETLSLRSSRLFTFLRLSACCLLFLGAVMFLCFSWGAYNGYVSMYAFKIVLSNWSIFQHYSAEFPGKESQERRRFDAASRHEWFPDLDTVKNSSWFTHLSVHATNSSLTQTTATDDIDDRDD